MSMLEAIDSYMDWVMDGSTPWSLTKLFGTAALAFGLIASPFIYTGYQNEHAMQQRIEMLDKSPTQIFNSVAQCVEKGHDKTACEASQKEALDIAGNLGTSVNYGSRAKCEAVHDTCEEIVTHGMIMVGKVMVPTTNYSYNPAVKAWQAAQDNLKEAVPLYQSAQHGMVVRTDGVQFPMP